MSPFPSFFLLLSGYPSARGLSRCRDCNRREHILSHPLEVLLGCPRSIGDKSYAFASVRPYTEKSLMDRRALKQAALVRFGGGGDR